MANDRRIACRNAETKTWHWTQTDEEAALHLAGAVIEADSGSVDALVVFANQNEAPAFVTFLNDDLSKQ